jgi:hypothetical protein
MEYKLLLNLCREDSLMQGAKRYLLVTGVGVLVLLVVGFILAALFHVLLAVLYIALIILATATLIAIALLIYAIMMLIRAIATVRNEMRPLLASVQETVGVVKETARTAGHTVTTVGSTAQLARDFALAPGIRAVATVMAGQQALKIFLGKGRARRAEERRREQLRAIRAREAGGE